MQSLVVAVVRGEVRGRVSLGEDVCSRELDVDAVRLRVLRQCGPVMRFVILRITSRAEPKRHRVCLVGETSGIT